MKKNTAELNPNVTLGSTTATDLGDPGQLNSEIGGDDDGTNDPLAQLEEEMQAETNAELESDPDPISDDSNNDDGIC